MSQILKASTILFVLQMTVLSSPVFSAVKCLDIARTSSAERNLSEDAIFGILSELELSLQAALRSLTNASHSNRLVELILELEELIREIGTSSFQIHRFEQSKRRIEEALLFGERRSW